MTNRVAIIDYGLCNVDSMSRAIEECGGKPTITDVPDDLAHADRIVLPGVGAFPDAMSNLHALEMVDALRQQVLREGAPLLGVCLGMQLLASTGEEVAPTPGLDLVPGTVERLQPTERDRRVPHMGWNEVYPADDSILFRGIEPGCDFYFVHSFHLVCSDSVTVAATTPYCGGFTSAVATANIFGVQFHPEKSQQAGFRLLGNFLEI